jgi:hypothetical protein
MKPQEKPIAPKKRQLPYLTEEDLNANISAVKIRITGSYTKRGDQRKEVFEEAYELDVEVPEKYNIGHVKLAANRAIKKDLKGIRARTWMVDHDIPPVPVKEKRKVRDFMSTQGLMDNESAKRDYEIKRAEKQAVREAKENGEYAPPKFSDETEYGTDGLPKFSEKLYVAGGG